MPLTAKQLRLWVEDIPASQNILKRCGFSLYQQADTYWWKYSRYKLPVLNPKIKLFSIFFLRNKLFSVFLHKQIKSVQGQYGKDDFY